MAPGRPILEEWFQRVWADADDDAIFEMFRPEGRAHGLGKDALEGPAQFKAFRDAVLGLVADARITILDHLENDAMNVAVCRLEARCRRSGEPVAMDGMCYYAVSDGVITHAENHFDFIGFFEQLGCLPQGTFAHALSGAGRQTAGA